MNTLIIPQIVEELKALPPEAQERVLAFTRSLSATGLQGIPGRQLLKYAGLIPLDDLELMRQAIEEGCEQVDLDEW